jgi:hypothetical protein
MASPAARGPRRRPLLQLLAAALAACALSGCLLISGEATTLDVVDGGGNVLTSFVSAEGSEERTLDTGAPGAELQVIAVVEVKTGDLELAVLQPDGSVAFAVSARPATQITRSGAIRADDQGRVRYRVRAQGARDGTYQIFVQP